MRVYACVCAYVCIYNSALMYIQHWRAANADADVYARAVPSGPKLSGEHAARERECPACEPRLRPPTFPHNTRTLPLPFPPPSLFLSLSLSKRASSRYRRPSPCLTPFSLRPRPPPPLTYLESATSTHARSLSLSLPLSLSTSSIIPDFCRLTEIQTGARRTPPDCILWNAARDRIP